MLSHSASILSSCIHRLPADSIHGTCRDGVIDILSLIGITPLHARESLIIEFEDVPRDSGTGTTSDTGTIHMGFAESGFESIEGFVVHR